MRVLVNTLPHVGGGGITYLKNMIPRFAGDVHQYYILVPAGRGLLSEPDAPNVVFKRVGAPVGTLPVRLLYEQLVLPVLLRRWHVDVLFSPADLTPLCASNPTLLAIRNPNPYFSASEYGLDRPLARRFKFAVQRHLTKLSARHADHVFFVSDFSREVTNRYLGLPDEKVSTIYHGIDPAMFESPRPPDDDDLVQRVERNAPYILTVSTVTEHKNFEVLLRGFGTLPADLRERYPLLIAGRRASPEYYDRLRRIVDDEGITDDVEFLGGIEYEDVPFLYGSAAAYVLPSKLETFGHTLVEAMASGVPIVAAEATCIPEITDGAALLFDPNDPSDLAASIERIVSDEGLRDTLQRDAQRRVADFSWDRTFAETKAKLEAIAHEPSA